MNIIQVQYTLQNKSLDIYLSGCKGVNGVHCKNCHNPLSWDFNQGTKYDEKYFESIKDKVKTFDNMIENIMIFGGEPNDSNLEELFRFLKDLKTLDKKVWMFTRYEIDEVPWYEYALCDYIKTGAYIPELVCEDNIIHGIKLATSNQFIHMKGLNY